MVLIYPPPKKNIQIWVLLFPFCAPEHKAVRPDRVLVEEDGLELVDRVVQHHGFPQKTNFFRIFIIYVSVREFTAKREGNACLNIEEHFCCWSFSLTGSVKVWLISHSRKISDAGNSRENNLCKTGAWWVNIFCSLFFVFQLDRYKKIFLNWLSKL